MFDSGDVTVTDVARVVVPRDFTRVDAFEPDAWNRFWDNEAVQCKGCEHESDCIVGIVLRETEVVPRRLGPGSLVAARDRESEESSSLSFDLLIM